MSQLAGERELAVELCLRERRLGHLSGGGEDPHGNREVVTAAFLRQVGGRQVDGDASRREVEARIEDGGADAVPALPDGGFREADEGELRQARSAAGLDAYRRRFDPDLRPGVRGGERHAPRRPAHGGAISRRVCRLTRAPQAASRAPPGARACVGARRIGRRIPAG